MEVDEQGQGEASYVTSAGSGGSVNVSLHPLVIMNISDHFTRVRMQQQQSEGRMPLGGLSLEYGLMHDGFLSAVYGVLLGTQKGRSIEICNSFELVVDDEGKLDREYFSSKEEQCKDPVMGRPILGLRRIFIHVCIFIC